MAILILSPKDLRSGVTLSKATAVDVKTVLLPAANRANIILLFSEGGKAHRILKNRWPHLDGKPLEEIIIGEATYGGTD